MCTVTPKLTSTIDMYICIFILSARELSKNIPSGDGGAGVSGGAIAGIVTAVIVGVVVAAVVLIIIFCVGLYKKKQRRTCMYNMLKVIHIIFYTLFT